MNRPTTGGSLARRQVHEKGVVDMRKLWRRPSPAMVVACAALLVALSGTGMAAATQLARNSVGTPQLKDSAVSNPKIKNNAVNSAKVAARSLLRSDFAPGQLPAGPVGPQGPAGPQGAAGPAGPAGAAGVIGAITVRTSSAVSRRRVCRERSVQLAARHALCARATSARSRAGRRGATDAAGRELMTGELEPLLNAQSQVVGFLGVGLNDSGSDSTFTVHVLCYTPTS